MKTSRFKQESGFTLVELLVVILIIGILAAIAILALMSQRQRANDASVESDVRNIVTQVETALISNPNTSELSVTDDQTDDFTATIGGVVAAASLSDGVIVAKVEKVEIDSSGEIVPVAANDTTPVGNGYAITAYHENGSQYVATTPLRYDSISGILGEGSALPGIGGGTGEELADDALLEETPDQLLRTYANAIVSTFDFYFPLMGGSVQDFLNELGVGYGLSEFDMGGIVVPAWIFDEPGSGYQIEVPIQVSNSVPAGMEFSMREEAGDFVLVGYYNNGQGQYSASSPLLYNITSPSSNQTETLEKGNDLYLQGYAQITASGLTEESIERNIAQFGSLEEFNKTVLQSYLAPSEIVQDVIMEGGEYKLRAYHKRGSVYTQSNPLILPVS